MFAQHDLSYHLIYVLCVSYALELVAPILDDSSEHGALVYRKNIVFYNIASCGKLGTDRNVSSEHVVHVKSN